MITTLLFDEEAGMMIRTKIMDTPSEGCAMSTGLYIHYIKCTNYVKYYCAKRRFYFCANCTKNGSKIVGNL